MRRVFIFSPVMRLGLCTKPLPWNLLLLSLPKQSAELLAFSGVWQCGCWFHFFSHCVLSLTQTLTVWTIESCTRWWNSHTPPFTCFPVRRTRDFGACCWWVRVTLLMMGKCTCCTRIFQKISLMSLQVQFVLCGDVASSVLLAVIWPMSLCDQFISFCRGSLCDTNLPLQHQLQRQSVPLGLWQKLDFHHNCVLCAVLCVWAVVNTGAGGKQVRWLRLRKKDKQQSQSNFSVCRSLLSFFSLLDSFPPLLPLQQDPLDSTLAEEYFASKTQYEQNARKHAQQHANKTLEEWKKELLGIEYVPPVNTNNNNNNKNNNSNNSNNNNKDSGSTREAPSHMVCPLTHELFEDPVSTPYGMHTRTRDQLTSPNTSDLAQHDNTTQYDTCNMTPYTFFMRLVLAFFPLALAGHTYEKSAILKWLENHNTDPLTQKPLKPQDLHPSFAMKGIVEEYKKMLDQANAWWS